MRTLLLAMAAWLYLSAASAATIVFDPPEDSLHTKPAAVTRAPPRRAARGLTASQLAVVVNTSDPLSVAIGDYYARKRHVPRANVIRVSFDPQRDELPVAEFVKVRASVEMRVGAQVQAYALTWARPYRVGCMSITSAFAFGFDARYCASGCDATASSAYFNAATARPHDDLNMRPTMIVAALDFPHAKALIDRGIRSDGSMPGGTAYLVTTDDRARNVRAAEYAIVRDRHIPALKVNIEPQTSAHDLKDVLFYFTGATGIADLATNRFLPGAIGDHLTSFGGMLTGESGQMSSLHWLDAGATGSYGTVTEPCNILAKFPDIPVVIRHYLAGETLVESYWKSVAMPGQGLFIGEPLAAPFRGRVTQSQDTVQ